MIVRSALVLFGILLPSGLIAQQSAPLPQSAGIRAPWDLEKTITALNTDTNRLRPVLEQIKPAEWEAKGASAGYQDQHKLVLSQLRSISHIGQQLTKEPERLTIALDLFFRLESLELNLESFSEGVRRYHNPAVSELIDGMRSQGSAARLGLREYVVELAAAKEQEFKIIDNEAQKCRSQQLRNPRRR